MYYHASHVGGIRVLEPRPSNHGVPLVYFSDRRENVLVYLSNAVEKVCREAGFAHTGPWAKWASYGFEPDGRLRVEEYYPDALEDTYRGVGGYIYSCREIVPCKDVDIRIPHAHISARPAEICGCERVPDALEALLRAEEAGDIVLVRYPQFIAPPGQCRLAAPNHPGGIRRGPAGRALFPEAALRSAAGVRDAPRPGAL